MSVKFLGMHEISLTLQPHDIGNVLSIKDGDGVKGFKTPKHRH